MSNLKRPADEDDKKKKLHEQPSSHGNDSKSVTPKDVSSQDASHRDVTERKVASDDPDEKEQAQLDDAVEMTFPASDPVAIPTPDRELEKRRLNQQNGR
jgi:hypothetical protein